MSTPSPTHPGQPADAHAAPDDLLDALTKRNHPRFDWLHARARNMTPTARHALNEMLNNPDNPDNERPNQ